MDSWINARSEPPAGHAPSRFNPCFNGFMDKCLPGGYHDDKATKVSTLVLMDSWINASISRGEVWLAPRFNPCFNGFMDKCPAECPHCGLEYMRVSTLVLMDSWINATR